MKNTIPRLLRPTSGLSLSRGTYRAEWHRDGKRLYKALATADLATAIVRRDAFYADMLAAGATVACGGATRPPLDPASMRYIQEHKGFAVTLPGKRYIGYFRTAEEAKEARNAALL